MTKYFMFAFVGSFAFSALFFAPGIASRSTASEVVESVEPIVDTATPSLSPVEVKTQTSIPAVRLDKTSPYSVTEIEKIYSSTIQEEQRLKLHSASLQNYLQQLLAQRNSMGNPYAALQPTHPSYKEISATRFQITQLKSARDFNLQKAYLQISLTYASVERGLSPEARVRIQRMQNELIHLRFTMDSNSTIYGNLPYEQNQLTLSNPYLDTMSPVLSAPVYQAPGTVSYDLSLQQGMQALDPSAVR